MALWPFSRKSDDTLTAASVNIMEEGPAVYRARSGEDSWQKETWRHYDICGELRYATNWISNAISLADMHAAEMDPQTGLVTGPTDNPQVQAAASLVLGGSDKRPQAQATIATNWQIAGECFIIVRPQRGLPDEWIILSSTEVSERSGTFTYSDPFTGKKITLTSRDKLIRHWNPHPSRQAHADSAVRAALPVLMEIERTSQNIAARLVSRLASNGVWLLPQEIDFPKSDTDPSGPAGVMQWLARAGEAAMSDVGQASSQMPLVMQIPGELIPSSTTKVDFASELSAEVLSLRESAIKRLALSLDMPMEIMTGMGDSNHWSAWQVEEAAYKIHVAPILDRLSESLTTQYLRPVLAQMGVANPERYILAFDTTEIISRPNRTEELLTLYDKRLISDDFMRGEAGIPDSATPTEEERTRRLLEELVRTDTALISDPAVRDCMEIDCDITQTGAGGEATTDPASAEDNVRALPSRPAQQEESDEPDAGLVAAAELAVFDALSRAGARMLTREFRGQYSDTPKHELYRTLPVTVSEEMSQKLLAESFAFTDTVADAAGMDRHRLRYGLRAYTDDLLLRKEPHRRSELIATLKTYGYGRG